jgi:hypothetical protein
MDGLAVNILFFSPYSGIWVHSRPEELVARELANAGHNIHVLRCDGILEKYCPVMTAYGKSFESSKTLKNKICATCKSNRRLLDADLKVKTLNIDECINLNDVHEINMIVKNTTLDNFESIAFDGLQIGRFATYEIFLSHKISEISQIENVWNEYLENLKQCLITYKAVSKYLAMHAIDRVVVYNSLYSLNRTAVKCAEKYGISWSTIHGGKNLEDMLQTLTISSSDGNDLLLARSEEWRKWKDTPMNEQEILVVKNNLEYIFSGKSAFTYSKRKRQISPSSLKKKYKIEADKKVLLCILSSADERFAADFVDALDFKMTSMDSSIFSNAYDWISYLIDFIKRNNNFHLILRAHPRMFPNDREDVQSEAGLRLFEISKAVHERVTWDFPQDKTSLYDLAEITNVVLNGTSTAGIELMALGLPVVIYDADKLFAYPREFNYCGETKEEYESAILQAAKDGWSIENSINAFRYRSFLFNVVTLSLKDAVRSRTRWSLERITDGLRNQKNLPIPVKALRILRKYEIRSSTKNLMEGDKLVRAVTANVRSVAELIDPPLGRSEIEERMQVLTSLREIARTNLNTVDDTALGSRILNYANLSTSVD